MRERPRWSDERTDDNDDDNDDTAYGYYVVLEPAPVDGAYYEHEIYV